MHGKNPQCGGRIPPYFYLAFPPRHRFLLSDTGGGCHVVSSSSVIFSYLTDIYICLRRHTRLRDYYFITLVVPRAFLETRRVCAPQVEVGGLWCWSPAPVEAGGPRASFPVAAGMVCVKVIARGVCDWITEGGNICWKLQRVGLLRLLRSLSRRILPLGFSPVFVKIWSSGIKIV